VSTIGVRAAFAHFAFTGISGHHLRQLLAELRPAFDAAREGRLHARRRHARRCRAGAGRLPLLTFADRLVLTLAYLRLAIPHEALAVAFGVDRSTVTRAIGQVRPLLARRGFATPTGVRLATLADVFAYAAAENITLRLDGTEVRVRRPRAHRVGRKAFISGKLKQNTIKGSVISDAGGSTVWCGGFRPGRMHDATAIRSEGIDAQLTYWPQVQMWVDAAYRGLAGDHPTQVQQRGDVGGTLVGGGSDPGAQRVAGAMRAGGIECGGQRRRQARIGEIESDRPEPRGLGAAHRAGELLAAGGPRGTAGRADLRAADQRGAPVGHGTVAHGDEQRPAHPAATHRRARRRSRRRR
jgi:hypothetical protein